MVNSQGLALIRGKNSNHYQEIGETRNKLKLLQLDLIGLLVFEECRSSFNR
jgi:hypothetical protein